MQNKQQLSYTDNTVVIQYNMTNDYLNFTPPIG